VTVVVDIGRGNFGGFLRGIRDAEARLHKGRMWNLNGKGSGWGLEGDVEYLRRLGEKILRTIMVMVNKGRTEVW